MRKLNFGCGSRFVAGWDNIDFYSDGPEVRRVNLLNGFPYESNCFDFVYSSHVLEHFTADQGKALVEECYRVLKPGGMVRVVVPDLELSVNEYRRVLDMADDAPLKEQMYRWIVVELLDQMVRNKKHGVMGDVLGNIDSEPWSGISDYIQQRAGGVCALRSANRPRRLLEKIQAVSAQKVASRMIYVWLAAVRQLVPGALRPLVFANTSVGERHQWMYDCYGMGLLLSSVGFTDVRRVSYDSTSSAGFDWGELDISADGKPYKALSLYMEGKKPPL